MGNYYRNCSYPTNQCVQRRCGCGVPGPAGAQGIQGPQGIPGLRGPTGPQGPAGAVSTILGSYDSLADLIAAHPTGNAGDMYIAGGVLYVWDAATNSWVSLGNIQGPAGPITTILGSYDTIDELREAHPQGEVGDAYLVGTELYVWDAAANDWISVGDLRGPAGPVSSILDSYDTLADLRAAHPTGNNDGDSYLVGGDLYVWDAELNDWRLVGRLQGPTGETGPVGTILGSYDTLQDLINAHPIGNQGDMYLVDGVLYVWNTETEEWEAVGDLRGPASESRTIIPFSSTVAPYTHSLNGIPTRVSLLGHGYGDTRGNAPLLEDYSLAIDVSDGHFDLDENDASDNFQLVFSLPFDMKIKSIVLTCGSWGQYDFPTIVFPFVQLYYAEPTSNSFRVIEGAVAEPEAGIGPGVMQRGTMRYAITQDLDISLPVGTRIAIGALMRTVVATTPQSDEGYWLYFTGSIGLAYDPS